MFLLVLFLIGQHLNRHLNILKNITELHPDIRCV